MRRPRLRAFWSSLTAGQRRTLAMMAGVIGALHLVGFGLLIAVVAPAHLASGGALTVGVGITAYTLGLRHAFDADHIAAVDNATRKLMADGRRPLSVGFWFSLGHSTIVFALAVVISTGARALNVLVADGRSHLHQVTTLVGIIRVVGQMRTGRYDETELEAELDRRGLLNRVLGRLTRTVTHPGQAYPIGLLFGLGFDTATEVALLVLAGGAAGAGLPWYAVLCLPVLFAAGMSLMDSIDGSFMNFAYGWALSEPVRKVFYNLTITGLSVAVAAVIGTIELGGLLATRLELTGGFWRWLEGIDLNSLGFVIVGLFVATWAAALMVWRCGRIEERWGAALRE